jgi:cytochrome d ubiquinol oxidase subunit II
MHLYDVPAVFILTGLALYTILGGADFGAGIWQLTTLLSADRSAAGRARAGELREHAHHAIGPVWEANHVWLIFVLTVTWTAYPSAFGAIASTLALPLLLAGVGIIFRGAAYALRSGTANRRELGLIDGLFSVASFLTPFALGTMLGAIMSGRVPPGNAAGGLISSWLNPTSLLIGVLAVVLSAYMAAVYLGADAARHHEQPLVEAFRRRALLAGACAGALATVGLPILHADAHRIFERLLTGPGLIGSVISLLAGVATLSLVATRRFEWARISAALAVAGLIIAWALAQAPTLLPGLSLGQAAASNTTIIALIVAIAMGVIVLFPALGLLFSLFLRGGFDAAATSAVDPFGPRRPGGSLSDGLSARLAIAGLLGGLGFLTGANPPWAHIIGMACLVLCAGFTFCAISPGELADSEL